MSTVRLPFTFREDLAASDSTVTLLRADEAGTVVRWFQTTLVEEHGTFVPFVHIEDFSQPLKVLSLKVDLGRKSHPKPAPMLNKRNKCPMLL
jgi:hypothetical protein